MPKGTGTAGKTTPGGELKKLIEQYKLSVRATALELGETPMSLKAVVDGKKKVTPELALKLEKVFGKKADDWVQLQVACDFAEAKGKASLQNKIAKMKKASDIESGRGPKPGSRKGAKPGAAKGVKGAKGSAAKDAKPKAPGAKRGRKPKAAASAV